MWTKAVLATIFAVSLTAVSAQTSTEQTTGNVVYTTTNPAPPGTNIGQSWTGFTNVTSTGGNTTGDNGAVTGYNTSTGTFMFGYNQGTIAYTYAINQALANAGTGIQVRGYNWSWDINNLNYDNRQSGTDTLTARITTYAANNSTILQQESWTYNTKFDWTTFSGSVNYTNPGLVSSYGNMRIEFSGRDSGYWAGYYGPMVRNIDVRLRYGVDECAVNPQSSPACPGYKTYYTMTDDGYAQVNLPFAFPFYGQVYTTSYMYTNGVVGFLNPNWGGYCCDGTDLNQQRFQANSPWNYAIYALNTDLYPGEQSRFYTQQTDNGTGIRYTWENVLQIGTNNENTFSVNIKDSGYIGINYTKINLDSWTNPLIGIAGDINQGQYYQKHYGPASSMTATAGTTYTFTGTETTDVCAQNPLYNPQCPNYAQAYLSQQCSINALYDPQCPGYAAAYLTYQCNISQLYSPSCPGYQQAYLDQQCGINPLYSTSCANYQTALNQCTTDPLSAVYCPGHQTAITDCSTNGLLHTYCPTYQSELNYCSADPLFNNLCPTYQTASISCAANALNHSYCPGYTTALNTCSSNPLSNILCSGYASANNACSANQLTYTYCPSYTTAIAACATNPQGNTMCPGYSSTASSGGSSSVTASVTEPAVQISNDGKVSTEVALVADSAVNSVITERATSTAPSPTATVNLTPQSSTTAEPTKTAAAEEKKEETKTADNSGSSSSTSSTGDTKKDQPKTARQEIQERRIAAAREKAIEAGKELANKMGEAASMESQVAVQNVVIQAMGFTPGFDAYNRATLPDAQGYRPFEIYPGQRVIDNPAGRRFLTGSDRLHSEMVDQQYGSSSQ